MTSLPEWAEDLAYEYELKELTDQVIAAKQPREPNLEMTDKEWQECLHRQGAVEVLPLNGIITIR